MRWLGMAKRALEIAGAYVRERESFGAKLMDHEGVQWLLGEAAMEIEIGRLLTMKAAWKLDQGDFARKEVSMRSEEHTSELPSLMRISYAVFCLRKNTKP